MPTFSNTTAVPVPLTGTEGTTTSTIEVSGVTGTIADLNLTTFITHTWNGDLEISLVSPSGTRVTLTDNRSGNTDDVFNGTVWDDEAATAVTAATFTNGVTTTPLQPEGSLADFDGEDPNGTWTLDINDTAGGDEGDLNQWSIDINDSVPIVLGIDLVNPSLTNAATVDYTVTFSDAVTGVDVTDFTLVPTLVMGASITNVAGSGQTYTVTVDTGSGDGTLQLNLVDDDSIVDSDSIPLATGTTGVLDGSFTGAAYTIDKTAPTVTSIDLLSPTSPTSGASIVYRITFSEAVTGVDTADFAPAATGITGASITNVATVSDTIYDVTVNTGSGDGTLGLDLVDNDSIVDLANLPLGGTGTTGATDGSFTGATFTIDKTAPTVTSIDLVNPSPTNAASVDYTITFSEGVSGVGAADFALAATGITGASITNVATVSLTTYTVTVNTGSGDGTLGLNLSDDDSIVDLASLPLAGTGTTGATDGSFTGATYTIDKTAPTVTSIDLVNPSPTNAATVDYTVTFSEAVTGVDAADFALAEAGITGASITSVTGSDTTYTVTVDTGSGDGTLGLDLSDDDSIVDIASLPLAGTGTTGATDGSFTGATYTIDKTAPTVTSIDLVNPSPTNAATVDYTVTFSEAVTGVDAADFALAATGITGASITSVTGSDTTYTVTVDTGSGDGTLGLDLSDDDSIVDIASLPLGGTGTTGAQDGSTTGATYTIDKTAPTVTSIDLVNPSPTNAATVDYTVTFSEAVTGVDAADFALAEAGITGASITSVTGSDTTYTVTVDTGSGDGTLRLDLVDDDSIVDVASVSLGGRGTTGATDGSVTGITYTIDKTAPVNTFNPGNTATNVPVANNIVITFNEAIRNLDDSEITDANVTDLISFGFEEGGENGADVPFTATINAEKTEITIDPDSNLNFSDDYYVFLTAIEDDADNLNQMYGLGERITFTTAAAPPPPPAPAPEPTPVTEPAPVTAPTPTPAPAPAPAPVLVPAPAPEEPVPTLTPIVAEPSPGIFLDGGLLRIVLPDFPAANPENCGTDGDDVMSDDPENPSDNVFCGLGGNDLLVGYGGADRLDGNNNNDIIFGNTGNDSIDGGTGFNIIFAGQDNDVVNGGSDIDVIVGDFGNDTIDGNGGNDVIFGNADADVLDGDDGDDWVLGGQGDDIVIGGSGNDVIRGNLDNDILIGGAGGDRFDFRTGDGSDIISDFTDGQDIIGLLDGLTFADLTISQVGNDTQITATGLSITLQSVNSGAIDTNDFAII